MHRASLMLLLLKIMRLKRDKEIPKLSQPMGAASLEQFTLITECIKGVAY